MHSNSGEYTSKIGVLHILNIRRGRSTIVLGRREVIKRGLTNNLSKTNIDSKIGSEEIPN